ncbi:YxiJ-like family protein [Lysinibacillus xylanilyticus]|uniref:YxiJ family protein n=1 Tax=Lysinibacillus xylanilyticus TaxID=582475 RepID=UPI002B3F13FF|nr:YxiJ-like family protein [Lysinibacillus xylanilyticus]
MHYDNGFCFRVQSLKKHYKLNLSEEDDCLTGDFNTYCMNISGTLNYVLAGKTTKIPKSQMEFLQMSFFDFFKSNALLRFDS